LNTLKISGCEEALISDKIAEQLHKLSPSSISAYSLGIKAARGTKYEIGIKYLEEAVSLAKSDSARTKYYFKLAEVRRAQKNFEEARSYLRKILQLDPKNARVHEVLGGYYNDFANLSGLGEFERGTIYWRSVDMYKKALSYKSDNAADIQEKIKSLEANFPKLSDLFFEKMNKGDIFQLEYWIKEKTKVRAREKN